MATHYRVLFRCQQTAPSSSVCVTLNVLAFIDHLSEPNPVLASAEEALRGIWLCSRWEGVCL